MEGEIFMPLLKSSASKDAGCGCGCGGDCHCGCGKHHGCHGFGKKILLTLFGVFIVYLIFYVGTLMRNNIKKFETIGHADKMERTIMINGYGKVSGNNDIAMTTLGYSNIDKDVSKAQSANKQVMDKVFADLKVFGIDDKDLQSDYRVYPEYNYTSDKGQQLNGYRVENNITIKIRDLTKISQILGLVGKYSLTTVSGLSYTIDDSQDLKSAARDKALNDASIKATDLADKLGVKLGGVVSYNEYEGANDYYPMKAMDSSIGGLGGGGIGAGPETVAAGSRDVVMNVNIVFELLSNW